MDSVGVTSKIVWVTGDDILIIPWDLWVIKSGIPIPNVRKLYPSSNSAA